MIAAPCSHAMVATIARAEQPAVALYGPGVLRRVECRSDARGVRFAMVTSDGTRLALRVVYTRRAARRFGRLLGGVVAVGGERFAVRVIA